MSVSPSRSVAIFRARVHSPAALCARAAASARRWRSSGSSGGVSRQCLLGRHGGGAALDRQPRGVVEDGGDVGVRQLRRQREVTGAKERVFDDSRDASVNALALLAQVAVKDGRQQRMGEADRPVLAFDHVRNDSRDERVCRNARPLKERLRRRAQRRGERERLMSSRRETGDPRAHELFERLGNSKRLQRIDVRVENAGQLQREERISARRLVDAEQCLARERDADSIEQEAMQRANAQRSHREPFDTLRIERLLEP